MEINNNLVGVSGKIASGKNLVGDIIQYLSYTKGEINIDQFLEFQKEGFRKQTWSGWTQKSYAGKIKQMVCLLLGCTLDQLEDREFKEKVLGEEWWYYGAFQHGFVKDVMQSIHARKEDAAYILDFSHMNSVQLVKLTPRKMLQLLGTDAGRNIIHPNIWINALFAEYNCVHCGETPCSEAHLAVKGGARRTPSWVITDVRFPGEVKAIQDRGGIVIRLDRYVHDSLEDYLVCHPDKEVAKKATKIVNDWGLNKHGLCDAKLKEIPESVGYVEHEHESETALDHFTEQDFDHCIQNDGTIEELILKIKTILE